MRESTSVQLLEQVMLPHPFWRYFQLFRRRPFAFLLDSAGQQDGTGAYSFMGADPTGVYEARRLRGDSRRRAIVHTTVRGHDGRPASSAFVGDAFGELRCFLEDLRPNGLPPGKRPAPFLGGAVGYFGYEAGYFVEELPDTGIDDLRLPEIRFGVFDCVLAHEHASNATYVAVLGRGRDERAARRNAARLLDRCQTELAEFGAQWRGPDLEAENRIPSAASLPIRGHFDRASYEAAVVRCKEHIARGDAYEICLTHRLQAPFRGDPWSLYRKLRAVSPSPFACYLRLPGAEIVSSSPERFLRLGTDRLVESSPIKGTRPRGASPAADAELRADLETSIKDRAENLMIVDLVRNDLGRVCEIGTVEASRLLTVESYATVFQLTSTIQGVLGFEFDGIDLVRAAFPGGSMTGAPKIEAMKIIDRLEPVKRGIYSGSIGYIDFSGALDLNIVIRTMVIQRGLCTFSVGGAVVADSDPAAEYDETMDKARALKLALAGVPAGQNP